MAVKFYHATHGTVWVQNPERDNEWNYQILHAMGRTAGGKLFVYKKGLTLQKMKLEWLELRNEEKIALQQFFEDIDGPSDTFTYTDHFDVSWTARFLIDELPWINVDDYEDLKSFFPVGGNTYPTTVRKDPVWRLSLEIEVE